MRERSVGSEEQSVRLVCGSEPLRVSLRVCTLAESSESLRRRRRERRAATAEGEGERLRLPLIVTVAAPSASVTTDLNHARRT